MFTEITTHIAAAQARSLTQYKNADNINNFIAAIVTPLQEIEGVLVDLNNLRTLSQAYGQQLDNLGTLVGVARLPGQSDASYLIDLVGQIGINHSFGEIEDIIALFQLGTGGAFCSIDEIFPASILLESPYVFPDTTTESHVIAQMQTVMPAGVLFGGIITYDAADAFSFAENPNGLGYGDVSDPTVGGLYASIQTS